MGWRNGTWGDDAPILGPDTTDDDRLGKLANRDSYKLVGSVCTHKGCLDGDHDPGCPQGN